MTIIYPTKEYGDQPAQRPDSLAYDLEEEKALIAEATEEIKKELLAKWQKRYVGAEIFPKKIAAMNPQLVQHLLAFANTQAYDKIAKENNLNQQQRDNLAQIVWTVALEGKKDSLKELIRSKLGANEVVVGKVSAAINENILANTEKLFAKTRSFFGQKAEAPKNINLPIVEALKKYPQLAEQLITGGSIKLAKFPAPARPSIKNWIADYRQSLGAQKHGIVERGRYVFEGENTKKLSSADRQRVAFIMKSLDEDFPLMIDAKNQQVIFPEAKKKPEGVPSFKSGKGRISFSSGHKLPMEQNNNSRQTSVPQRLQEGNNVVDLRS